MYICSLFDIVSVTTAKDVFVNSPLFEASCSLGHTCAPNALVTALNAAAGDVSVATAGSSLRQTIRQLVPAVSPCPFTRAKWMIQFSFSNLLISSVIRSTKF